MGKVNPETQKKWLRIPNPENATNPFCHRIRKFAELNAEILNSGNFSSNLIIVRNISDLEMVLRTG